MKIWQNLFDIKKPNWGIKGTIVLLKSIIVYYRSLTLVIDIVVVSLNICLYLDKLD